MKLVFATHNLNKFEEVKAIVPAHIQLLSLTDLNCFEDIPETGATLQENANIKAEYVRTKYNLNCFADDTGLEVNVLHNAPGVYSARYAGFAQDSQANMQKLLNELKDKTEREAQFRTVIALNIDGNNHLFEGICKGKIISEKIGDSGFGYDPIFQPEGYDKTFAQMSQAQKNDIGHRGRAIRKLIEYLNTL